MLPKRSDLTPRRQRHHSFASKVIACNRAPSHHHHRSSTGHHRARRAVQRDRTFCHEPGPASPLVNPPRCAAEARTTRTGPPIGCRHRAAGCWSKTAAEVPYGRISRVQERTDGGATIGSRRACATKRRNRPRTTGRDSCPGRNDSRTSERRASSRHRGPPEGHPNPGRAASAHSGEALDASPREENRALLSVRG